MDLHNRGVSSGLRIRHRRRVLPVQSARALRLDRRVSSAQFGQDIWTSTGNSVAQGGSKQFRHSGSCFFQLLFSYSQGLLSVLPARGTGEHKASGA